MHRCARSVRHVNSERLDWEGEDTGSPSRARVFLISRPLMDSESHSRTAAPNDPSSKNMITIDPGDFRSVSQFLRLLEKQLDKRLSDNRYA